jgi:hypothetical protein
MGRDERSTLEESGVECDRKSREENLGRGAAIAAAEPKYCTIYMFNESLSSLYETIERARL